MSGEQRRQTFFIHQYNNVPHKTSYLLYYYQREVKKNSHSQPKEPVSCHKGRCKTSALGAVLRPADGRSST